MAGVRALPVHLTAERPERALLGATDVRALAASVGLLPTKSLGQNFVIDGGTVERIVRTAALRPDDVVLEIGPGLGSLTLALLPGVRRVVAVEIDQRLAGLLPETVAARLPLVADRLRVIHRDAMVLDATEIGHATAEPPTAIVANLPYNVAVPVLLTLLARLPSVRRVLVMVQLEVAERLAAKPAEEAYGVPSVKAAWYGDVRLAGTIGRQVFWPAPRVDSGLVALDRREPPETTASREAVFAVIDAAFGQRRKTLRAALASWAGSPAAAETALRAAGIDPSARGETLDVVAFARIAEQRP
ncbi:MAG: rRNA (adenine1518-N6/adenine1519-N6)-dimethyltransferase [Actinomycetota bacterium]|nr:rRNA (adenine1518-N6/adenine1519-N6)-dimethyltransferase [Actinomycetota bacterium]